MQITPQVNSLMLGCKTGLRTRGCAGICENDAVSTQFLSRLTFCRHEDTMATKTLNDLLLLFMQDVYYAERQILKALPKMAKATQNAELKNALMHHREETQGQIERLQKAFEALGKRARGQTCEAINGIIEEGEEVIEEMP